MRKRNFFLFGMRYVCVMVFLMTTPLLIVMKFEILMQFGLFTFSMKPENVLEVCLIERK